MKTTLILITLCLSCLAAYGQQDKPKDCPPGFVAILTDKGHWKCEIDRLPIALPVTLVYFKSGNQNGATVLYWATATESNNSHYEVQGSDDAKLFQVIGTVYPEGPHSSETRYYRFKPQAYQYYRLVQVDITGERTASHIVTGPADKVEKQIIYNTIGQRISPVFY
jgi:hypothetical protein